MTSHQTLDLPPAADETDVLWFLPTHGDGRYLGSEEGARHVTLGYLSQIARAADELGYFGVLLPTGRSCEESWVIASAMVPLTQRLRFLVAVSARPHRAVLCGSRRCDARPALRRAPPHQPRDRRRPGGAQGGRHIPRPWRALYGDGRVPHHLAQAHAGRGGYRDRQASPHREGEAALPAAPRRPIRPSTSAARLRRGTLSPLSTSTFI
jgi:hypothetical protein